MQKVEFPAVLVLARFDEKTGKVLAYPDNKIIESDADLARRLGLYQGLEEAGGIVYTAQLTEVANADRVVAERVAWLEWEHSLRDSPYLDPEPEAPTGDGDPLDQAVELARAAFANDPATLRRLERGLELAKAGQVWDKGNGQWWVRADSYGVWTVNGTCTCPDSSYRGRQWCKHRLAVALVVKAASLGTKGGVDDG